MNAVSILFRQLTSAVQAAAWLSLVAIALLGGCAEKAVEKSPEEFEKAREKHFEMMRRESGQAPAPAPN